MALYELRTYTLHVGKMPEMVKLLQEIFLPALQKGGQDKKLVGFFQSDTGMMNQLIHLWKYDDDADRRAHWAAVRANTDLVTSRDGDDVETGKVKSGNAGRLLENGKRFEDAVFLVAHNDDQHGKVQLRRVPDRLN